MKGISVVIPAYNHAHILAKTLACLSKQKNFCTWPFEIIIVDNNSTSAEILNVVIRYRQVMDITLHVRPKLPSPCAMGSARNIGTKLARYSSILFLDSDMLLPANTFQILETWIEKHPEAIVTCQRRFVNAHNVTEEQLSAESTQQALSLIPVIYSVSSFGLNHDIRFLGCKSPLMDEPNQDETDACPHPWAYTWGYFLAVSKARVLACGGYNEMFDSNHGHEDIEFGYRYLKDTNVAHQLVWIPKLRIFHQEPDIDHTSLNSSAQNARRDFRLNPNLKNVCNCIPGYWDFISKWYRERLTVLSETPNGLDQMPGTIVL